MPDYQGIGLGTRFLNEIAKHYSKMHFEFSIVTSAKNMIYALQKSDKWQLIRYSAEHFSTKSNSIDAKRKSLRHNCKTASFFYKGE